MFVLKLGKTSSSSSYSKLSSSSSQLWKSKKNDLFFFIFNIHFAAVAPFLAQSGGERTLNSTARNNQLKVIHPMQGGKKHFLWGCQIQIQGFGLFEGTTPTPLQTRFLPKKQALDFEGSPPSLFRHRPEKGPRMVFLFGLKNKD